MKNKIPLPVLLLSAIIMLFWIAPASAAPNHEKQDKQDKQDKVVGWEKEKTLPEQASDQAKENLEKRADKLDPYGHAKDDRMDLYGNRGRPIRDIDVIEPPPPPDPPPVVDPPEPPPDQPPVPPPDLPPDQPPVPPPDLPPDLASTTALDNGTGGTVVTDPAPVIEPAPAPEPAPVPDPVPEVPFQ